MDPNFTYSSLDSRFAQAAAAPLPPALTVLQPVDPRVEAAARQIVARIPLFRDLSAERTVLNYQQIEKISPRLNKLLKLQQLLRDFTGLHSLKEAIQLCRSDDFGSSILRKMVMKGFINYLKN